MASSRRGRSNTSSANTVASRIHQMWVAFWSIVRFVMFFAIALVLLIELSSTAFKSADGLPAGAHPDLIKVANLINSGQPSPALTLSQQLLAQTPQLSAEDSCWLLQQQTDIYRWRGHYHLARDAIDQCLALNIDEDKKQQQVQLRHQLQQRIDSNQAERHLLQEYANLRQSGYAKKLTGDVVLIYVYLEDNLWQGWSGPQRFMMRESIEQAVSWYQQQAVVYQQKPANFDIHYYHVQMGRGISASWLRSQEFFADAAPLLLTQMGYSSWQQMHDLITNYGEKQLAVIFHSNQDSRSFAQSCPQQATNCSIEYVMLTEASAAENRWLVSQVQAHEMAHLFGAADLYNIQGAKDYATTDLMNYYSAELQFAEIAPITAWALGWRQQPVAPFQIEE